MNALEKAIQDLRAVVEAYALGKVEESAFVLPANAVLAAYAARPAPAVPEGYALIGIDVLRAWGKLDEVRDACRYPISAAQGVKP